MLVAKLNWVFADYSYATVMAMLPTKVASKVIKWGKENIDKKDVYTDDDNKGLEDEPHITVLYGLTSDNPFPIRRFLESRGKLTAKLGKVSLFENDEYDVVKIEVISKDLSDLHNDISEKFDNENEFKNYKPHVTIAYVKKGKGKKYAGSPDFAGIEIVFEELIFSKKDESKIKIAL